jgi:plastocyanin
MDNFGLLPSSDFPGATITVDPDGAAHATIPSPVDNVHSVHLGTIFAARQDQTDKPQTDLGPTRVRATFPNPGVFPYQCSFHDNLGMTGMVIVFPKVPPQ